MPDNPIPDYFPDAWRRWLQLEVDPKHPDAVTRDPDDPGGATKYGIAQKYHPDVDVASMSEADARRLLYAEYWMRYGLHRIAHKNLAIKTLTLGGLIGMGKGIRMLQTACNMLGASLVVDGMIGPASAAWINAYRHPGAVEEVLETQATTYLVAKGKATKIAGWLIRVDA